MRKLLLLAALVWSILALGCRDNPTVADAAPVSPSPDPTNAPPLPAKPEPLIVSGPLIVEHQVDVTAQRDGIVAQLSAEPGQKVKAGDPLAHLDDRQLSADLEAARAKTRAIEADLKNWQAEGKVAQADYERAQKMWEAQVLTREQLEHARFKAESEQWDIKRVSELLTNARESERSLELELEKTTIRAPFSGLVARRYVRQGQQVIKGDRLFWVTAEAPLLLRFTLPERYMGRIHKGQQVPLTSPDTPDRQYTAKVTQVSPVIDPASGTMEILAELVGPVHELRPGMTASVHFENPR